MLNSMTNTHTGRELANGKERERGFPVCLKSTKDLCQTVRKGAVKSARRIYKSSKSDLMPYCTHPAGNGEKKDETKMMHGIKSVCQSKRDAAGHAKAFAN